MTETPTDFEPNAVPCVIHFNSGKQFVVEDTESWGYIEQGLFAGGHFADAADHKDIIVLAPSVEYIELDFPRLKEQLTNAQ